MKHLIIALAVSLGVVVGVQAAEEPKTKKVCEMQKQADGKTREVCKEIRIHKKLESQNPNPEPVKK